MEVLLAAAKKGRVEELCRVAEGADLEPAVIDVDMLALMNGFELNYPEATHGPVISLIHLGASMMTVLILKDGLSIFQRDIPFGGNQYTAALQNVLAVGREEAEALKLGGRPRHQSQGDFLAALRSVTEEIVIEIQRSVEFYRTSAGDEPIDTVYLSGGCAGMKGLCEILTARLKLPVERFNPFRRIDIPERLFDVDYVSEMGPMAAVAVGLAIRQEDER
jgi:type IV pilus assembly protein PilM